MRTLTIPRTPQAVVLVVASVLVATSARGQLPQPRLQGVFPAGGQVGSTVELTLSGTDLEGVNALWFDHSGLRASHQEGLTFQVTIAPGTPLGHHDVRAVGPLGVSNPRTFVVGNRPEAKEVEPNHEPDQASPLTLNTVVNGQINGPTDIDWYAFEGRKGQRVFLDLAGARIESRLDATLRLIGPDGSELSQREDVFDLDPFLDVTLPADGRYLVRVSDVIYAGSPDHVYRLTLHEGPHLDAIVPVVAEPGIATTFTLIGRHIGGEADPELQVEGRLLERKTVTLTVPASEETGSDADLAESRDLVLAPFATRRGREYREFGLYGASDPVFVAEATEPVLVEQEPNDDASSAQTITLPCDLSGTFGTVGDLDIYRFEASQGQVWIIDAQSEAIGSPADPTFVLQKVVEDGPAQEIATGDDTPDRGAGVRFHTASVDATLRWEVPEDGTYQLLVSDLYASQRGDSRLSYRLRIRAPRPDFHLFVVPADLNAPEGSTLRAGGRVAAYVWAWRQDGFSEPIRVEARELPPGVSCEAVMLGPGQPFAPIVFTASDDAPAGVGRVRLVGRTRWEEPASAADIPDDASDDPGLTREARAGGLIWPSAAPNNPTQPALARVTRGFVLAVLPVPAPYTLTASPGEWVVAQGRYTPIDLALVRREGFTEAVQVTGESLPPNLPNVNATIDTEATAAVLPLFVPKDVAPGEYTIVLQGTGAFPFSKDPDAEEKPNVNVISPSNTIRLTVRPSPVNLAVDNRGGALTQGETLEVSVTVNRQNDFADAVELRLVAPEASKLSAEPVAVPADQTSASLVVTADPDSPTGAAATVFVRAVTEGDAPVEVDEPLALTIHEMPKDDTPEDDPTRTTTPTPSRPRTPKRPRNPTLPSDGSNPLDLRPDQRTPRCDTLRPSSCFLVPCSFSPRPSPSPSRFPWPSPSATSRSASFTR